MCASTNKIPLLLIYGSEVTVLLTENKVFKKEKRHFIPYSRESMKEY